jgi:hypothetical protein
MTLVACLRAAEPEPAWTGQNQAFPEVEELKKAVLDNEAKEVKEWTFSQGHCTYSLTGRAAYIKAGGSPCGIYFKGQGEFKYVSNNPAEFPVMRFNLAKQARLKPEISPTASTISQFFGEATFWFSEGARKSFSGTTADSLRTDFDKLQRFFRDMENGAVFQRLALRKLDPSQKPYFHAEMKGEMNPWVHIVDEMEAESLSVLNGFEWVQGYRFDWTLISEQPIGWSYKAPRPPKVVLTHADINLESTGGDTARLRVKETYLPLQDGLKALDLQLFIHQSGTDSMGIAKARIAHIRSIRDETGKGLPFDYMGQGLLIPIAGLKANVPVTLNFEIDGNILPFQRQDNYWLLRPGPWFPMPQEFSGQAYTVHAYVKLPKEFVPFMGGDTIQRKVVGDQNVLETKIDKPIQFFSIAAGKYEFKELTKDGLTIRVAGYSGLGSSGAKLLDVAMGIARYYEGILGPFPFKELNIVELHSYGQGQAPPGMVFITTEAFHPIDNLVNRIYAAAWINQGLAHEIAHQYWGIVVKMWSPEDQWITESFAEYCSALAIMNMKGKDKYEILVDRWHENAEKAREAAPIPLANRLRPKREDREEQAFRHYLIYSKGAFLLYRIHKDLGDADFLRFLRSYQKSLAWQHSTTAHIPMIIKALTGKDYTKFMEDYYWGLAMPPRKP